MVAVNKDGAGRRKNGDDCSARNLSVLGKKGQAGDKTSLAFFLFYKKPVPAQGSIKMNPQL